MARTTPTSIAALASLPRDALDELQQVSEAHDREVAELRRRVDARDQEVSRLQADLAAERRRAAQLEHERGLATSEALAARAAGAELRDALEATQVKLASAQTLAQAHTIQRDAARRETTRAGNAVVGLGLLSIVAAASASTSRRRR